MPEYIIRIIRQVQILEKVEEKVVNVPTLAAAQREAAYILGEKYADQVDIVAETGEKEQEEKKSNEKAPF